MWESSTHQILYHRTPGRQTISVGIWIAHGSANDPEHLAGATHLVEHLTLRRCGGRDRLKLAQLLDRLGGEVDAWTATESMGLSVQTTLDALPEALGILRDAILYPSFSPEDVSLEAQVALAEYQLAQDDPADRVGEAILHAAWGDHPLARPIIGSPSSISALNPETLEEHHQKRLLRPDGLIIGVVGDLDISVIENGLKDLPPAKTLKRQVLAPPVWKGRSTSFSRSSVEQTHARLAFPAVPVDHPDALVFTVLSRILGGGNSSRLFQKLREESGLCYDIWSAPVFRSAAGLLEVGWACSAKNVERVQSLVLEEIEGLSTKLREEEVEIAQQGLQRSLQMEAETAQGRASLDIGEILDHGRRFDLQTRLRELREVDLDLLRKTAHEYLRVEIMASARCEA